MHQHGRLRRFKSIKSQMKPRRTRYTKLQRRGRKPRPRSKVRFRRAIRQHSREFASLPSVVTSPYVSVIIPVMNERSTIGSVVREARSVHTSTEVIVVANGSTDGSDQIAERAGARVLRYPQPLGHDVGRTAGALAAQGEVLLFIDGDMIIPAARLRPFIHKIEAGADVALNHYSGPTNKRHVHRVVLAKHVLNELLSRPDLKGMSMTAVPHAMSRKALETIGAEHLSIPPMAHAIAIHKGLRLTPAQAIDVGKINKKRTKEGAVDPLEQLIDNDHLQSIRWMIEHAGPRGGYSDLDRQRHLVR